MPTSKLFISFLNIKEQQLPPQYVLKSNEVHIYSIFLPNFSKIELELTTFLNSAELARANRFHKELDKSRFIICRSILKIILAGHTQLNAKTIQVDYNFNKKPFVVSHPSVHFNISHSEDYAVIAVSSDHVGVDIEYISEDFDFDEILSAVFNDNEIMSIQKSTDKKNAFYTFWTRKEAFVKALSKGIDDDFIHIPCLDGEHTIDKNQLKTSKNWDIFSFNLSEQYLGAVSFESLPTDSRKIVLIVMPNTMKGLLELTQLRKN